MVASSSTSHTQFAFVVSTSVTSLRMLIDVYVVSSMACRRSCACIFHSTSTENGVRMRYSARTNPLRANRARRARFVEVVLVVLVVLHLLARSLPAATQQQRLCSPAAPANLGGGLPLLKPSSLFSSSRATETASRSLASSSSSSAASSASSAATKSAATCFSNSANSSVRLCCFCVFATSLPLLRESACGLSKKLLGSAAEAAAAAPDDPSAAALPAAASSSSSSSSLSSPPYATSLRNEVAQGPFPPQWLEPMRHRSSLPWSPS